MKTFEEAGVFEPKHSVGDVVWKITSERKVVRFDCPDCLGSKSWECTSPAGQSYEVDCPRCTGSYSPFSGVHGSKIPGLDRAIWHHSVMAGVVTYIKIDKLWDHDEGKARPDYYYLDGSANSYVNGVDLYATKEEAEAVAKLKNAEELAKDEAKPETIQAGKFSEMTFRDAQVSRLADRIWEGWMAYRWLAEEAGELVRPNGSEEVTENPDRNQMIHVAEELDRRDSEFSSVDFGPIYEFMLWMEEAIKDDSPLLPTELTTRFNAVNEIFKKEKPNAS
jgi:predicted RNA-binding Zn-ribbon protein involved in translation (DUF1610 family)